MLTNHWYIAAYDHEIRAGEMRSEQICGKRLLFTRDQNGTIQCIENRCSHRNVELSMGDIEKGVIRCGYHGWAFDCSGTCVDIPSLADDETIPKTANIRNFPVRVKDNLVWVYTGDNEPQHEPMDLKPVGTFPSVYTSHTFNGDLKFISESLFDPYHIGHVHTGSIGTLLGSISVPKPEFNLTSTDNAVEGWYERENTLNFFEKFYFGSKPVRVEFGFYFPNVSKLDIFFDERRLVIYEHMVEVEPNCIKMIQITAWDNIFSEIIFPAAFARWFMRRISNQIVGEDIAFFESHYRNLNGHRDVHVRPDEASIAFRKLWESNVGD